MDRKKLIGTIIGIILFGTLIAGATYAWLTYSINFNNDTYNFNSTNFSINYTKSGNISGVPLLSGTPQTSDFATKGKVDITAKRTGTVNGNMKIYLYTDQATSDLFISKNAIKYALAIGNHTIANADYTGYITNKTMLLNTSDILIDSTYDQTPLGIHVYVWLDAANVDNDLDGLSYSGYIGATAEQVH